MSVLGKDNRITAAACLDKDCKIHPDGKDIKMLKNAFFESIRYGKTREEDGQCLAERLTWQQVLCSSPGRLVGCAKRQQFGG